MLRRVLESLRREYHDHRMARFAVWVIAYGIALWVVDRFGRGTSTFLWFLFWVTALPTGGYYLFRLQSYVRRRVMWRLRRRLVAAYVFIGMVPIALILVLVWLGLFILSGQFAAFLVANRLSHSSDQLRHLNRAVTHLAEISTETTPRALADYLQKLYVREFHLRPSNYPSLEVTLRVGTEVRAFFLDGRPIANPVTIPSWLGDAEFAAIVSDQGRFQIRAVEFAQTRAGPLRLVLSQPIAPALLDQVGEGIGPVGIVTGKSTGSAVTFQMGQANTGGPAAGGSLMSAPDGRPNPGSAITSQHLVIPPPANSFDFKVYGTSVVAPVVWGGDQERKSEEVLLVYVTSRVFSLSHELLSTLGELSSVYVTIFYVVASIFLVIELISLVIGIRLNRSITVTVDRLYEATERVKRGDFSHRVGLPPTDQLSALGAAFDGMTASVERLLQESLEKTRLEGELEIAREVQRQLFPQLMPDVPGMELHGVCKPARVVSGDYYDFLPSPREGVALVLGDVSGKGISAALLMASIQSALHAQLHDGNAGGEFAGDHVVMPDEVVRRLNNQLYESTPREKYATFFYGVYDGSTHRLSYTNAGHPPPALFRRGRIERLTVGGTVVGLFPSILYEQGAIELEPGDVLLAFTDGMTEPENSYGEEFGEKRLFEVARRCLTCSAEQMVDELYRAVNDWTGSPELQDDMTMLVAKAVHKAP